MKKKTTSNSENKLYYGDNLEVLRKYINTETIDLCYIDPPFNSKRNYNQIYNNIGKEDKAQAQAFVDTWVWDDEAVRGYNEIITNSGNRFTKQSIKLLSGLEGVLGQGSLLAYLVSMTLRIAEIHRVLKPTGSFYFHCDPTSSHYLKLVIDSVFCPTGGDFKNEIIWSYDKWTAPSNYQFQRNHDVVFFYAKKDAHINIIKEITDNLKEKYKKGYLIGGGGGSRGLVVYDENNTKVKELIESGNYDPVYAKKEGKPISDVWRIPFINPSAKERLGYPTQKPEALLERIIEASTNKGDLVLDAYCGCGTTIAVAQRLQRKWVGIDITYQSISLILRRLMKAFGNKIMDKVILNGVPEDIESAIALANKKDDRIRKEFEKWAVLTYSDNHATINEKKGGDGGIDGTAFMADYDDENKQVIKDVLFSVKSGKNPNIDTLRAFSAVIDKEKAALGYYITLYPMPNLVKESKKFGTYKSKMFDKLLPKITVVTIEEILKGARIDLPQPIEVVKNAEAKTDTNQITLF